MAITYPNQRIICVHREPFSSDFLGIKNENWQAACRDLRPHAFVLYLYLASNKDNYNLALSPAAVAEAIGMPRSTYHDQIKVLISKGYLVPSHGNTYDFYEKPRHGQQQNCPASVVQDIENCPPLGMTPSQSGQTLSAENTEINNKNKTTNNSIININDFYQYDSGESKFRF